MLPQLTSAALLGLASLANAQARGFNYGSTGAGGAAKSQQDFESEFRQAQGLQGVENQFTSARLYTMIQANTPNTVISAIPAAIATKTRLLLGLWGSAGQDGFNQELTALRAAISQFGPQIAPLIDGISVGSEDLYRETPTGIQNKAGVGASPDAIASYIRQVRDVIAGGPLSGAKIGHVDTWTAWVNGSNQAVIDAVDWVGMDAYPYFQNTIANSIDLGANVFNDALQATIGATKKDVWVTETGWPVSGPQENQAVASVQNAGTYWQNVACSLLGVRNTWWYTLQDAGATPSFGVVGAAGGETPLYPLTCSNKPSASSSAASKTDNPTAPTTSVPAQAPGPAQQSNGAPAPQQSNAASSPAPQPSNAAPQQSSGSGSAPAGYSSQGTTLQTVASSKPTAAPAPAAPSAAAGACPTALSGAYEYPHLIVPVDKSNPSKAEGTSYNGKVTKDVSSIFNFDIPQSLQGKTCSLVFLFPQQKDLQTSSFTTSGSGGIDVAKLKGPADTNTSYSNKPAKDSSAGSIPDVKPGNSYVVATGPCAAGQRVGYEASATGSLSLDYFQDYNPSPIGFYVTSC